MSEILKGKIQEGFLAEICNTKPIGNAKRTYVVATIEWDENSTEDFLFFTQHEAEVARARAERHPELHPKPSTFLGVFKNGFSQIGHVVYVKLEKKTNRRQPDGYYFVRLVGFDGHTEIYAFTPFAMTVAQRRVARNPEDKPKKSAIADFVEDVVGKFK